MKSELIINLCAFWAILAMAVTLFPIYYIWNPKRMPSGIYPTVNLIPFVDFVTTIDSMGILEGGKQIVGNALLLAPLGIFAPF